MPKPKNNEMVLKTKPDVTKIQALYLWEKGNVPAVRNMSKKWLKKGNLPPTFYVYGTEDPFYDQFEEQYQVLKEIKIKI